jgi:hypothetical protein
MSQLQQVRANAAWVAEHFGRQSGIEPFACTPESVDYLDQFLERQEEIVQESMESTYRVVSLLGAYLGECIIAAYGGEWQEGPEGPAIVIRSGTGIHVLQPFQKVYKRIVNGAEDSLGFYFTKFIPQVLASA